MATVYVSNEISIVSQDLRFVNFVFDGLASQCVASSDSHLYFTMFLVL